MLNFTNKRNVGLLDVDNTLIFGSENEMTYNNNLLDTFAAAGILDIYLFTSMSISAEKVQERQKLVEHLQSKGFTVHGVITTSDMCWHLDKELMDDFLKNFTTVEEMEKLFSQEKYLPIKDVLASKPGIAFAIALKASEEQMPDLVAHSKTANNVIGLVKRFENKYETDKAYMYNLFAANKPEWMGQVIFADDDPFNIKAIEQANADSQLPLLTIVNRENGDVALPLSFYQKKLAPIFRDQLQQSLETHLAAKKNQEAASSSLSRWFKTSYLQEQAAVTALNKALSGESVNLASHVAVLRQGDLGNIIRSFVKRGAANGLCNAEVNTVRDFVRELHQSVNQPNLLTIS
ncbi:hypothetical protein [Legionella cardiaca]|uniref:Dot/Icm T4SS effector n=1 Tax=Legionella cardiaca TaxID=1071983 RepID=A0ABY8ARC5_9GAMM|nr:hypothetical protein [Legionella cardiaca]WED43088.1 hypothetical protein PXX05_14495 [Legionella cardiaca]